MGGQGQPNTIFVSVDVFDYVKFNHREQPYKVYIPLVEIRQWYHMYIIHSNQITFKICFVFNYNLRTVHM